jgi:hypothetical protein
VKGLTKLINYSLFSLSSKIPCKLRLLLLSNVVALATILLYLFLSAILTYFASLAFAFLSPSLSNYTYFAVAFLVRLELELDLGSTLAALVVLSIAAFTLATFVT